MGGVCEVAEKSRRRAEGLQVVCREEYGRKR